MLSASRLVTLTGAGGAGKTRLSLQVAAEVIDDFNNGVWFIDLAPLSDAALVPSTILNTLGLRDESRRAPLDMIADFLRPKRVLLIPDNCEHLVEACARLSHHLLTQCPQVKILATSREGLDVAGETLYHVPSLSLPDPQRLPALDALSQYEAVHLFIERASAVQPHFAVTNLNAPAVAQICFRLDGIPLAIELAAARIKHFSPDQIAARLDDRFRLLMGSSRTAVPRQQTLRAAIDWSYSLLSEPERILFRRLSVFAGGWSVEAAESVCASDGLASIEILDLLVRLVDKSLVVTDTHEADPRYHLLETIRQFAREKLFDSGGGEDIQNRHLEYFRGMAERAEPELTGLRMPEWLKRLEKELDNVRAALEWSLKQHVQVGLRLASALLWFWDESGYLHEGSEWLAQLLSQLETQAHTIVRARVLGIRGYMLVWDNSAEEAQPILEESVAMCRKLGDRQGVAFGLIHLGIAISNNGDSGQGRQRVAESLALYQELGDKFGTAWALTALGGCIGIKASPANVARASLEEGLPIFREMEFLPGIVHILVHLGQLAIDQGDYRAARPWLEESLAMQRQLGRGGSTILNLANLGEVAFQEGDYKQARAYYEENLSLAEATGNYIFASGTEVRLGYVALREGDRILARRIFEKRLQYFRKAGNQRGVVRALEGFASLAVAKNQPERAARVFAWADAMRETIGYARPLYEQTDMDRDLTTIHVQLDEVAFAALYATGRALTMEQAIELAVSN